MALVIVVLSLLLSFSTRIAEVLATLSMMMKLLSNGRGKGPLGHLSF
jgi:hypothetical protein